MILDTVTDGCVGDFDGVGFVEEGIVLGEGFDCGCWPSFRNKERITVSWSSCVCEGAREFR